MAKRGMRPEVYHGGWALALSLLLAGALLALFRPALGWAPLIGAWLVGVNVTAFGYYGFDKGRARSQGRRIPEVVLHGLALLGGSLGAYTGMRTFRHKTIKGSFRIVFWVIVVCQVGLIAAVIYRLMKP